MSQERSHQLENPNYNQAAGWQQAELEKSQSSAQREMTSIHIKMKNQSEQLRDNKIQLINLQQLKQNEDMEANKQIVTSNHKISSFNKEHNKQKVYKSDNSDRKDNEKRDSSVLNVIHFNQYHKGLKQDMEMINNNNEENGEDSLVSPENKVSRSKCTVDNTLFSLFFTLVTVAGIILYIYSKMYWLLIVGAVLYYLECCCSSFSEIYERVISENDFSMLYKNALCEEPQIQFKASAFMIVIKSKKKTTTTTTATNTNAVQQVQQPQSAQANNQQKPNPQNNPQSTQNKQSTTKNVKPKPEEYIRVRELVYSEQRSFDFSSHKDFSHPLQSQKEFFNSYGLIRICPIIYWRCGNEETLLAYEKLQKDVTDLSKQRSDDIEKSEYSYSIPFENSNFIVKSSGKSSPFFFNKIAYYFFSAIFLSFPYRIYYLNTIRILQLYICKKVFI